MNHFFNFRFVFSIIILFVSYLAFCAEICSAQGDSWEHSYGGTRDDSLQFSQQTSDGGFIMGGHSNSFSTSSDNYDAWVLKLYMNSDVEWQKKYATTGDDRFFCGQQTSDGGYIFAGSSDQISGNTDVWIVKTDSTGTIIWQKVLAVGSYQEARSIQQTSDSGYIVLATSDNVVTDFWVIKLTSTGTISWQKTIGGSDIEEPKSVRQTADGGYILAGGTFSFGAGGEDAYIIKLTSTGSLSWNRVLGETNDDIFNYAIDTSDGGYIAVGSTLSFGTGGNVWIVKFNSSGDVSWQKHYGGTNFDSGFAIIPLSDGYLIGADTDSFAVSRDLWVFKIDSSGTLVWQKTYGSTGTDILISMSTTTDGGFIMGAQTDSYGAGLTDFWLLKISSDGSMDSGCTVDTVNASVANSTATAIIPASTTSTLSITEDTPTINSANTAGTDTMQCGCTVPIFAGLSSASDVDCCSATGVRINWPQVTNWGNGSATTGTYDIRRYTTAGCTGTYMNVRLNLAPTTTTYLDTSGTPNTQYYYQVRAKNNCNPSVATAGTNSCSSAVMDSSGTNPDLTGINNDATDVDCFDTGVRVIWPADPANWEENSCAARTYDVLRNGSVIKAGITYGTTAFIDTLGSNNTNYTYQVKYNNGCTFSSITAGANATDNVDITPCPNVGNALRITKSGTNTLLNWTAVTCSDLANYRVYSSISYSSPFPSSWTILGNPTAISLTDPLASSYIAYKILSVDACGNISSY